MSKEIRNAIARALSNETVMEECLQFLTGVANIQIAYKSAIHAIIAYDDRTNNRFISEKTYDMNSTILDMKAVLRRYFYLDETGGIITIENWRK